MANVSNSLTVEHVKTTPYPDQKPGTSGLRKKVKIFQQKNYTENFIQAILLASDHPKTLVVGGDGRYFSHEAINITANICAANGVEKLYVSKYGLMSTPAASCLIRHLKLDGGILMTASHNPGGPDEDFGIKFNTSNGAPALPVVTDKIQEIASSMDQYKTVKEKIVIDLESSTFEPLEYQVYNSGDSSTHHFTICPIDSVDYYTDLMKEIFEFTELKEKISLAKKESKFDMLVDCMHGVMGPYAKRILVDELGLDNSSVINSKPLPDFGGHHPDPNLVHAKELIQKFIENKKLRLGAAFDGDGDRCMIIGEQGFFVTPSDSLAVMAAGLSQNDKYYTRKDHCDQTTDDAYQKYSVARSFPTAPAVDRFINQSNELAREHNKPIVAQVYETPTGWKFFTNLLDHGRITLCGEESFGAGSLHIREKDGLWTVMMWLRAMAQTNFVSAVKELTIAHWKQYGRDYCLRYDFDGCTVDQGQKLMDYLESLALNPSEIVGKKFQGHDSTSTVECKSIENFTYYDPVDGSVAKNQGVRIQFDEEKRVVYRLSGTSSSGVTVRVYFSDYNRTVYDGEPKTMLADTIKVGLEVAKFQEFIERTVPDVET